MGNIKVNDLYTEDFTNVTGMNKEYKKIKEAWIDSLGLGQNVKFPHGIIVLLMNTENGSIKMTSSSKEDMIEYIKKYKGNTFKLFIKGNEYMIK